VARLLTAAPGRLAKGSLLAAITILLSAFAAFGTSNAASAEATAPVPLSPEQLAVAQSSSVISPNSCQGSSATLTLETNQRGYNYNCSGTYTFNADTTYAYFVFPGGWSGYVSTKGGTFGFCDWQNRSLPNYGLYSIYLSPVKEPWC
jgi:hypothetical protein